MFDKKVVTSENFYSDKYSDNEWLNQRREDALVLIEKVKELDLFNNNTKVLDAGCGSGENAIQVMERYKSEVYGIDLNKTGLKVARGRGVKTKFVDLDDRWPFKSSFFDVVIATEVIEHVVNPDNFLEESRRVLKKNGVIIITTPNLAAWFNRLIFLFGYQPFFLEVSTIDKTVGLKFTRHLTPNREPLGHIRCFTLKAMLDMFDIHKFDPIEVKGNRVYYLPTYFKLLDSFFSYFPSLATDMLLVGRRK